MEDHAVRPKEEIHFTAHTPTGQGSKSPFDTATFFQPLTEIKTTHLLYACIVNPLRKFSCEALSAPAAMLLLDDD